MKKSTNDFSNNKKHISEKAIIILSSVAFCLVLALAGIILFNHFSQVADDGEYEELSEDYINKPLTEEDIYFMNNEDAVFYIKPGEDEFLETTYKSKEFSIPKETAENIINDINSISVKYSYEELYDVNKMYNSVKFKTRCKKHSKDITNGTGVLDAGVLYNTVCKNNKEYLKSEECLTFYTKLPNKVLKESCNQVVENLNKIFEDDKSIDKNEVFCLLADLKILNSKLGFFNASYSQDNILFIKTDKIETYQNFNQDVDATRQVFCHECYHIIQATCPDNESENTYTLGVCQEFEDAVVNSMNWIWLNEASAENSMAKLFNEDPKTYFNKISYFDSLKLITMLNKDVSISEMERISYDKNIDDFFKLFNVSSEEEKKEIIKAMYSIDIMQSSCDDFYSEYKEKYGIDLSEDSEAEEKLRLNLRISILETFTKEFYKSLANLLSENKISSETLYYLLNIYETDIFNHLYYNEKQRIINGGVEFFDFYTDIQNKFFKSIYPYTEYGYDEMLKNFENYSMNVIYKGEKIKNYSLDFLDKNEKYFLSAVTAEKYQTGIPPVRTMVDYCKDIA